MSNSNENNLLALAISIAAEAFKNKFDKKGEPYILHCLRVMNKQVTIKRKIIGVLHDLIEDVPGWTYDRLMGEGFGLDIIIPLRLLDHSDKSIPYDQYIRNLSTDADARAIKLADLEDNSQITRLKGLSKKDFERVEQYHKAYTYLSKV